jgi:hypothetical protein
MNTELERLERKLNTAIRWNRTLLLLGIAAVCGAFAPSGADEILRARGLVIVDEQGRERILIGAPIPAAKARVRTDLEKVKQYWAPRFGPQYLDWYADYRHDMNGMLVLDENGFDRVALGQDYPDPNIGQRIGRGTGLILNDAGGFERSGYGIVNVEGKDRVVLGLDSDRGTEAAVLVVREDGSAGLSVHDGATRKQLFVGKAPKKSSNNPGDTDVFGVLFTSPEGVGKTVEGE